MQGGELIAFYRKCKSRGWNGRFWGVAAKLGVLTVQPSLVKDGLQCIARGQSGGKMSRGCETA